MAAETSSGPTMPTSKSPDSDGKVRCEVIVRGHRLLAARSYPEDPASAYDPAALYAPLGTCGLAGRAADMAVLGRHSIAACSAPGFPAGWSRRPWRACLDAAGPLTMRRAVRGGPASRRSCRSSAAGGCAPSGNWRRRGFRKEDADAALAELLSATRRARLGRARARRPPARPPPHGRRRLGAMRRLYAALVRRGFAPAWFATPLRRADRFGRRRPRRRSRRTTTPAA